MTIQLARPNLVCHRGASLLAPENTVSAFKKAVELGGNYLEFDVHQSKDGVLYVIHDETVDRTTNGSGKVSEMTSAELDELDAGAWFDPRFEGERLPKLEEFLAAFKGRISFYVEVKYADCQQIAHILKKLDLEDTTYTFSFNADMRRDMRKYAPDIKHMILWEMAGSVDAAIREHGAQIMEFHPGKFEQDKVRACQDAGLEVSFFTDEPDEQAFKNAIDWKINYLNIDHQELFAKMRSENVLSASA